MEKISRSTIKWKRYRTIHILEDSLLGGNWTRKYIQSSLHVHKTVSRNIHKKLIMVVSYGIDGLEKRQMRALWEEEFSSYTFYVFK